MSLAGQRLFKALVAAALEYHAREPWEDVADDEPFAMRLEGEPEPVFASVMGQGGLEYGLALFRGEGALGFLRTRRDDDRERFDSMRSLAVTLQPLRDIPAAFRTALTRAGLERRREDIAPFFISKSPGRRPRDVNASEARLLLLALRGILSAFDRGALPVRASAQSSSELLTITVTGDPRSPDVAIGSERFEGAPVAAAPRLLAAPEDLAQLPRLEARWLVGFPLSEATIAGDERLLRVLLIVDEDSSKVILARAIYSTEFGEAANAVFEAMDGSNRDGEPGRPREIVVSSRDLFDLLAPALAVSDIPCRYAERIEAVETAAASFNEFPSRRGSGEDDAPREAMLEGHRPADDDLEGWKAADLRVTGWLLDQVSRSGLVSPREVQRFLGGAEVLAEAKDAGWRAGIESALLEWAAVDVRRTRKGGSLVDRLLRDDAPTPEVRAILEGRRLARPGLFRVAGATPGESLELVDIVAGDSITVHDRMLSRNAEAGEILPIRIMRVGQFCFPVNVGPAIPPAMLADALAHLRGAGLELTPEGIARDWRLLGRLWAWSNEARRRRLASAPMRIANNDGENIVWHVASYSVADEMAARRALEARPDIERAGERYSWLRRRKGLGGGDLSLGQIEFVGGEIVAQVNSAERHERSRTWLEAIPGVKFLGFTRRRLDRPEDFPRDDRPSADEEAAERRAIASLPPEARESLGKLLRQHYLDWIDHPLPMLGGETPRERCRTAEGRREVAALIRGIPGNPAPGGGTIEPPREEMLRRLGLLSDTAGGE